MLLEAAASVERQEAAEVPLEVSVGRPGATGAGCEVECGAVCEVECGAEVATRGGQCLMDRIGGTPQDQGNFKFSFPPKKNLEAQEEEMTGTIPAIGTEPTIGLETEALGAAHEDNSCTPN